MAGLAPAYDTTLGMNLMHMHTDIWAMRSVFSHFKGFFATPATLPTPGADGDYAVVGTTDTMWVWDSGTAAWKDTGINSGVLSFRGEGNTARFGSIVFGAADLPLSGTWNLTGDLSIMHTAVPVGDIDGSNIEINAGPGGTTGGRGGDLYLSSGDATFGDNDGGDVRLTPGIGNGTGRHGKVIITGGDVDIVDDLIPLPGSRFYFDKSTGYLGFNNASPAAHLDILTVTGEILRAATPLVPGVYAQWGSSWGGYGFNLVDAGSVLLTQFQFGFDGVPTFSIKKAGALAVGLVNYEDLVTDPNDIPNKQYIDDALSGISGGLIWSVITGNTQAVKGHGYFIDASSNPVTLTLPAAAAIGDMGVGIRILNLSNTVTVARNGHNIEGVAADLTVSTPDDEFILTYATLAKGYVTTPG